MQICYEFWLWVNSHLWLYGLKLMSTMITQELTCCWKCGLWTYGAINVQKMVQQISHHVLMFKEKKDIHDPLHWRVPLIF